MNYGNLNKHAYDDHCGKTAYMNLYSGYVELIYRETFIIFGSIYCDKIGNPF